MEYILMALFGGGSLDWEDVGKTQYNWNDIIDFMKEKFCLSIENLEINDFYNGVLLYALKDLENSVKEFISNNKDNEDLNQDIEILESLDINEDFYISCNCLDTHCSFIGNTELKETLLKYFQEKIDEIDENIGFTYINMED